MNSNFKNNQTNNKPKPFCKVCADAGKNDTAHFVRSSPDPKSQVLCPTLLALECRYCAQTGHTVKYCALLKKNNKDKEREQRRVFNTTITATPTTTTQKNNNKFALLDDDDEEINHADAQLNHADAQLNHTDAQLNHNTATNSWANIASKQPIPRQTIAATQIQQIQIQQQIQQDAIDYGEILYAKIAPYHYGQAGMIVAMLLELQTSYLDTLIIDSHELALRVADAVDVLNASVTHKQIQVSYNNDADW
jgi:hypothetical protein